MKHVAGSFPFGLATALLAASFSLSANGANQAVGVDPDSGLAAAVVVENKALAHTTQLLPLDADGAVSGDTLEAQLTVTVGHLKTVLEEVGSGLESIARLNVYVTSDEAVGEAQSLLKSYLGVDTHPAVTNVVTPLADPAALVALDAIASVRDDRAPEKVLRHTSPSVFSRRGMGHVSVLPKGRTLYISGMAESVDDLVVATVGTMKQLHGVLALNKITSAEVVHLKAFMKPVDEITKTEKVMAAYYPDKPAPAMSFVGWRNGIPIEIELIAHIPEAGEATDPVQLLWPPEVVRSPVYCRYSIVNSATRIYTKGFTAGDALDADGQIRSIFDQLKAVITPLGSDFRHLVKATYYHSEDDTSNSLNAIRPELYDPERPPAASKAKIAGTGDVKRTMIVDMIAVPK